MYLDFYKLNLKPFQISTDPRFLWLGAKHEEALAVLKYAIRDNRGFLLLTGDVGTGKTTLLNALIDSLGDDVHVALVTDPGLAKMDFYNFVADSFGIDRTFRSKGQFLIFMKRFLLDVYRQHKQTLLIIDESQNLSQKMLEEVRLLSNIEIATNKLINIFFVGQIEFNDIILRKRNRAIRQRITVNYNISTLTEPETETYIRYRLKIAGSEEQLFTSDAINEIYHFSNGYPRLINIICDQAMLAGYVDEKKKIDRGTVAECAAELRISNVMDTHQGLAIPEATDEKAREKQTGEATLIPAHDRLKVQFKKPLVFAIILSLFIIIGLEAALFSNRKESTTANTDVSVVQQSDPQASQEPVPVDQDQASTTPDDSASGVKSLIDAGQSEGGKQSSKAPAANSNTPQQSAASVTLEKRQPSSQESQAPAATTDTTNTEKRTSLDEIRNGFGDFPEIKFDLNSNTLDSEAYYLLGLIASHIRQHPETALILRGYTDKSGSRAYNIKLAEFRADMVKTYLAGKGVRADTISTLAIGPDAEGPAGTSVPYDGNRRKVVIEIIAPE